MKEKEEETIEIPERIIKEAISDDIYKIISRIASSVGNYMSGNPNIYVMLKDIERFVLTNR